MKMELAERKGTKNFKWRWGLCTTSCLKLNDWRSSWWAMITLLPSPRHEVCSYSGYHWLTFICRVYRESPRKQYIFYFSLRIFFLASINERKNTLFYNRLSSFKQHGSPNARRQHPGIILQKGQFMSISVSQLVQRNNPLHQLNCDSPFINLNFQNSQMALHLLGQRKDSPGHSSSEMPNI